MSINPETLCERCGGTADVKTFMVTRYDLFTMIPRESPHTRCVHCRSSYGEKMGVYVLAKQGDSNPSLHDIRRIVREELERSNP